MTYVKEECSRMSGSFNGQQGNKFFAHVNGIYYTLEYIIVLVYACCVYVTPEPPTNVTLSASGNGVIRSGSDVIIPASVVNVSFSLHCHVDTNETLYYQWWSGGVLIGFGYDRETLSVVSSDPWNVTGSYQCIVSNIAGQASPTAISVLISKLMCTNVLMYITCYLVKQLY